MGAVPCYQGKEVVVAGLRDTNMWILQCVVLVCTTVLVTHGDHLPHTSDSGHHQGSHASVSIGGNTHSYAFSTPGYDESPVYPSSQYTAVTSSESDSDGPIPEAEASPEAGPDPLEFESYKIPPEQEIYATPSPQVYSSQAQELYAVTAAQAYSSPEQELYTSPAAETYNLVSQLSEESYAAQSAEEYNPQLIDIFITPSAEQYNNPQQGIYAAPPAESYSTPAQESCVVPATENYSTTNPRSICCTSFRRLQF